MELQSIDHSRVLVAAGALCCDVWNCSPWITAECFSGMQFLQCRAGDSGPTFLTFLFFFSVYATVCRDGGLAPVCCLVFVWACDGVSRRWSRSRPCLVLCVGMGRCVETVVSLPSLSGASCGHATVCRDGGLAPVPVWCFVWAWDGVSRRWSRSRPCLVLRVGMGRCVETVVSLPSLSCAFCGHGTVCRDGGLAPVPVWCFVWACDGVSRRWSRSRPCLVLRVGMGRCVETVVSLPSLSGASCGHGTVCRDGGLAPVRVLCFVWAWDGVSRRWSRSRPCLVLRVGMRRCVETVVSLPCMSSTLHSGPGTACQDGDPAPTLGSVIFVHSDSGPAPTHAISGRALDCCKGVLPSSPLCKR
jgi:hypothetical protein